LDRRQLPATLHDVAARAHELLAASEVVKRLLVGELELGVVAMRVADGRSSDTPVPKDTTARRLAEALDVVGIPLGVGRLFVENDDSVHQSPPVAGGGTLTMSTKRRSDARQARARGDQRGRRRPRAGILERR